VELYGRVDMFCLVDAVSHRVLNGHEILDQESQYYLAKLHRKFKHHGCGIAEPTEKERFDLAQKRLHDLERQCNQNLHEENAGLWFTVEELEGVPQSLIGRLKNGTDPDHEGMLWVATKVPQSSPVIYNATREATRRKMYYAVQNRMSASTAIFRELILLRDETARMLGYPNHAALKTAGKMVGTPQFVNRFLAKIGEQLIPHGREVIDTLKDVKAAETETQDSDRSKTKIFLWDRGYYTGLQTEAKWSPEASSDGYFELQTTLAKLLDMLEHILGTCFVQITKEQQEKLGQEQPLTWHEDVQMYSVWNTDGVDQQFLGYAYFDFYPREGKYTHSGSYSLQQVCRHPPLLSRSIPKACSKLI